MERTQRGLRLDRNPLGIKASMRLIGRWLVSVYGATRPNNPPASLFWNSHTPPFLLTWEEAVERGGGIGPDRLITYDQLLDNRFIRTAARQWFIEGEQKDYSFYSDPSYAYLTLFCYIIMTGRTISTEAWDLARSGAINRVTPFLAGGTIWESLALLRRGAEFVVLSNYDTPQVEFYKWAAEEIGVRNKIKFVDEKAVPFPHEALITNEYLEHVQKPIDELNRLLVNKPAFAYHRSGFNLTGHGHFIPLIMNDKKVFSHSEADEVFDDYCSKISGYRFSLVTGGWRDSVRKLERINE